MEMYQVRWKIKIIPYMNLLIAKTEGKGKYAEMAMLYSAVALIKAAEKFNGRPISEEPTERSNSPITVQISLAFQNESDMINFFTSFQSKGLTP